MRKVLPFILFLFFFQAFIYAGCSDVSYKILNILNYTIIYPNYPADPVEYPLNCSNYSRIVAFWNSTNYTNSFNFQFIETFLRHDFENNAWTNSTSGFGINTSAGLAGHSIVDISHSGKQGTYFTYNIPDGNTGELRTTTFRFNQNITVNYLCKISANGGEFGLRIIHPSTETHILATHTSTNGCQRDTNSLSELNTFTLSKIYNNYSAYLYFSDTSGTPYGYQSLDNIRIRINSSCNTTPSFPSNYTTTTPIINTDLNPFSSFSSQFIYYNNSNHPACIPTEPLVLNSTNTIIINNTVFSIETSPYSTKRWAYNRNNTGTKQSPSNYYQTYLIFNNKIINPTFTVLPSEDRVFKDFKNSTTNAYYAPSNAPAYFYVEEYEAWFMLFPYAPTNTSIIQTSIVYYFQGENTSTNQVNLPILPLFQKCYLNSSDNNYYVNISLLNNSLVLIYYLNQSNGTNTIKTFTNNTIFEKIPINSSVSMLFINVNGNVLCSYSNNSLFNIPQFMLGQYKNLISYPLFLGVLVLSIPFPYASILVLIINEAFNLISVNSIFFLIITTGIVGVAINSDTKQSLRAMVVYVMVALSYLLLLILNFPTLETDNMTETYSFIINYINQFYTALIEISNFSLTLDYAIKWTESAVKFGSLLLQLPNFLHNIIYLSLFQIHPILASFWTILSKIFLIIILTTISLKIFTIVMNQFDKEAV